MAEVSAQSGHSSARRRAAYAVPLLALCVLVVACGLEGVTYENLSRGGRPIAGTGGRAGESSSGGAFSEAGKAAFQEGGTAGTGTEGGSGGDAGGGGLLSEAGSAGLAGEGGGGGAAGPKRVFVSSVPIAPGFGGIEAADALCQTLADAQTLGGTFGAWLSDTSSSPSTRFEPSELPYVLLDGTPIAINWADLIDGSLLHGIDQTELGLRLEQQEVWTGTLSNGTASTQTCADWTNTTSEKPYARVGLSSANDVQWTNTFAQFCDRTNVHLYCFEQ